MIRTLMTAEQAKQLKESALWDALCVEIDQFINMEVANLRQCGREDLERIQSKITAYELLKNLPNIVIDREE